MNEPADDLSSRVPVLEGVAGPQQARRARNYRRVGVVVLAVVVVLACLGWLGPKDGSATGTAGSTSVTVTYPQITRSGVDTAIEVAIEREGAGPVRIELPASAVDEFGLQTYVPAPASQAVRGDTLVVTFEGLPAGEVTLRLLGRMPTRATLGRFTHPLLVAAGSPEPLEVDLRTWVLP